MNARSQAIDLMATTMRRLRRIYDLKAAAHGLTLARLRVLRALRDRPGLSQLELAQDLQIEAPTLKRQIDALIAADLVARGEVASGGRGKGLYLTKAALAHEIYEFTNRARAQLLADIDEAELAVFTATLRKIGRNIDRLEQE